jgi:rubrerythrin
MSIQFSADEMLRVAEQIERNGIAFYTAAAQQVESPDLAELLLRLASWETGHARLFASLREKLTARERETVTFDPDNEISLYLRSFADSVVFTANLDPSTLFDAHTTPLTILQMALARERDSIVFYTGLHGTVPAQLGADKVERIISEEYGHAAMLQQRIADLV